MRPDIIPYESYHPHLGYTLAIACLGWLSVSLLCLSRPQIRPHIRVSMYAIVIALPVYAEVVSYVISLLRPAPDTPVGYYLTHFNAYFLDHLPLDTWLSPGTRALLGAALVGLILLSLARFGYGTRRLRRRMVDARPLSQTSYAHLASPLGEIAAASGAPLPLILVSDLPAPLALTTGVVCPTIYVTAALLRVLEIDEAIAVLCHEWAHVRRRDLLWNGLLGILRDMVWYFPGAHLAWRSMTASQDEACDALAVRMTGQPLALARALLKIAGTNRPLASMPPAVNFFARGQTLTSRIQHMLRLSQAGPLAAPPAPSVSAYLLTALLLLLSVLPALLGS
jgi:Zn-dependent protease with chaperone function